MPRYIDADKFLKSLTAKFKCVPLVGVPGCLNGEEYFDGEHLDDLLNETPAADVAPRAEIAEEIFNEIAKIFSEKQRSYENSHQSGKARQMMVARFEVHKLHQKYKEAHNG